MVNVLPTTIVRGSLNGKFTRKNSKIQSEMTDTNRQLAPSPLQSGWQASP